MAIGLILGQDFEPTEKEFNELMAKGAIKSTGFQYVTAEVTMAEARDREKVKEYYRAACLNQDWKEGLKYAGNLKFSDVVVFGKPVLIVEPQGVEPPEAKPEGLTPGGIIAGIGFMPTQSDLKLLNQQIKLKPGHEYVLRNFSRSEASSDISLTTAYILVARNQGWSKTSGPLSIQRRTISGKDFLMIEPARQAESKPQEEKKVTQSPAVTQAPPPVATPAQPEKKKSGLPVWVWILAAFVILAVLVFAGSKLFKPTGSASPQVPLADSDNTRRGVPTVAAEGMLPEEPVSDAEPEEPQSPETVSDLTPLERARMGEFAGLRIEVLGRLSENELMIFNQSVQRFEDETGIEVLYDSHFNITEFQDVLRVRVSAKDPPDIVDFPQPIILEEMVRGNQVVDLGPYMEEMALYDHYSQAWLDLGALEGPQGLILAGIWHRANTESTIWYPKRAFEAAGYQVPTTWDELMELTEQIAAEGGTAWCIGMESEAATGWIAVKWIENILLRTAPPETFDEWVSGQLPFASAEVIFAAETMSRIWFNPDYVYGGKDRILKASVVEAVDPMFEDPPQCWFHLQGSWVTAFFPNELEPGVDYHVFPMPPVDERYGRPLLIQGNIMAMFNDRPEVRALMAYFATAESAEDWARSGYAISPHRDSDLNWYPNDIQRVLAETILMAEVLRVDGSDRMPPEVGHWAFWGGMVEYVEGADLATVLQRIDQSWPDQ